MSATKAGPTTKARHDWRERIDTGIYRNHKQACPSQGRKGLRCGCPYSIAARNPDDGRTVWRKIDGTLSDARRARADVQVNAGTIHETSREAVETLHEFATRWLRTRSMDLRPATIVIYERHYSRRIAPYLGDRRLDELTRRRVQEWLAMLLRNDKSRRQVELAVDTLRSMLSQAVREDLIPVNVAKDLPMPRPAVTKRRAENVLTQEETERMIAHGGGLRNETLLRVLVECGLRRGEAIGLRWPEVGLTTRCIVVNRSIWQAKGGERIEHSPKGGRTHKVKMTADLAGRLEQWYRTSVLDDGADALGFVWPGVEGRALSTTSVVRIVTRAQKRAGLIGPDDKARFSAHSLRHTAASTALAAGVPLLVVSKSLGHADQIITAQHYSHLLDDSQLDAFAAAQRRA